MNSERVPGDGHFSVLSVLFLMTPWLTTLFPDITVFPGNVLRDPAQTRADRPERAPRRASPRGSALATCTRSPPPGPLLARGCCPAAKLPAWHPGNALPSNPLISGSSPSPRAVREGLTPHAASCATQERWVFSSTDIARSSQTPKRLAARPRAPGRSTLSPPRRSAPTDCLQLGWSCPGVGSVRARMVQATRPRASSPSGAAWHGPAWHGTLEQGSCPAQDGPTVVLAAPTPRGSRAMGRDHMKHRAAAAD